MLFSMQWKGNWKDGLVLKARNQSNDIYYMQVIKLITQLLST